MTLSGTEKDVRKPALNELAGKDARPVLELRGISRAFGPRLLFRKVDLNLAAGRIYLLHGANGAGKSTLMKIMAGLARPDMGEVLCRAAPEKVVYVAHATFLYPGLSALENLEFWAEASGLAKNRANARTKAMAALAQVGLERHAHERAGIFSRGMSQRLNLARMLLAEPELLLLDEPGTGLDVASRALLNQLVESAAERGACVVWISHDLEADSRLAHDILHLENRSVSLCPSAHGRANAADSKATNATSEEATPC